VEDIHSQVEKELTDMIGPAGRKVIPGVRATISTARHQALYEGRDRQPGRDNP
jgi:hypothetical protein